jgi:hypothetical protein
MKKYPNLLFQSKKNVLFIARVLDQSKNVQKGDKQHHQ